MTHVGVKKRSLAPLNKRRGLRAGTRGNGVTSRAEGLGERDRTTFRIRSSKLPDAGLATSVSTGTDGSAVCCAAQLYFSNIPGR